jgi:ferric-dicitrate binding protein FerR (iron transport regulator)
MRAHGQVHVPAHAYAPQPEEAYHQPAAEYDGQPEEAEHEHRDFRRTRSRKGMLTAAALVVVAVGGVAAAMVFRNGKAGRRQRPAAGDRGR